MDWNLLGFSIPGGEALPVNPEALLTREEVMETAIKTNGSAEYHAAYEAGQESVSHNSRWQVVLALALDLLTIACIAWLLTR